MSPSSPFLIPHFFHSAWIVISVIYLVVSSYIHSYPISILRLCPSLFLPNSACCGHPSLCAFLLSSPDPVLDFPHPAFPLLNAMVPVCSYRSRWTARVVIIRLGVRLAARLMSVHTMWHVLCVSDSSFSLVIPYVSHRIHPFNSTSSPPFAMCRRVSTFQVLTVCCLVIVVVSFDVTTHVLYGNVANFNSFINIQYSILISLNSSKLSYCLNSGSLYSMR